MTITPFPIQSTLKGLNVTVVSFHSGDGTLLYSPLDMHSLLSQRLAKNPNIIPILCYDSKRLTEIGYPLLMSFMVDPFTRQVFEAYVVKAVEDEPGSWRYPVVQYTGTKAAEFFKLEYPNVTQEDINALINRTIPHIMPNLPASKIPEDSPIKAIIEETDASTIFFHDLNANADRLLAIKRAMEAGMRADLELMAACATPLFPVPIEWQYDDQRGANIPFVGKRPLPVVLGAMVRQIMLEYDREDFFGALMPEVRKRGLAQGLPFPKEEHQLFAMPGFEIKPEDFDPNSSG